MTNRRQVIGAGIALGLLPAVRGLQAGLPLEAPAAPLAVGCVLVDARHSTAAVMGAAAAEAGFNTVPLPRDVMMSDT